jgi:S-adenosylmethionine:tRNA ribosyltransferase-isomerase
MERRAFAYELPPELIAQEPLALRSASRLLVVQQPELHDHVFSDLADLLSPGDLLVCNDTRVLPARLAGRKKTGGRVELLLERVLGPRTGHFQIRASKSPKAGGELELNGGGLGRVLGRDDNLFEVEFDSDLIQYLEAHGSVPLPPYIDRPADANDSERYQTVFAREAGAVAAPTAGLHFDDPLFERLGSRGIDRTFLTLHVGAGTFAPVRGEQVEAHKLHAERVLVSQKTCDQVLATKARGGRIIAAGTTVVRALEAAALERKFTALDGETQLFIFPGFRFQIVDLIVTNFHLPESSLLMLVCAFAGREHTLAAYRHAVAARYRFFSYGDAMLMWPAKED